MSRVARWKLEKTKVKVVFRLQFHATHVPQTGWDKLFISFIPADSGKATAKTTKANVRNGTCKWGDPIYETTRLLQDTKTKQYDEKLYKLVVTMGSSRSSILGETNINLADYADASKPSSVALPLFGCDSGTVLHVTVQLLTSKTGFREFEQQRELRESGLRTTSDQNRNDVSTTRKISSSEDTVNDQMDKMNSKVKFRELSPLEEGAGPNEEYADSTGGFECSSNTSESLCAEKHDTSSTHEIDSIKSTASGDLGGLSLSQSPGQEKRHPTDQQFLAQGTSEWAHSWGSEFSADADLPITYEENSRLRGRLEAAELSILELKQEVSSLQVHADEIGNDAKKISLQLDAEIASGEQLAKEVSVLRSECSKLKEDLEEQKSFNLTIPFSRRETIETSQVHIFHQLQLRWFKGLSSMEDKLKELQRKAILGVNERDFQSCHSDFEALLGVLQVLKQETGQASSGMNMTSVNQADNMTLHKGEQLVLGTRVDADFYQLKGAVHCISIPGLVSQDFDTVDAANAMKGKFVELLRELDELRADRESLAKKADQMECYYEALIHELEENQRQMMGELQSLRNEHSTCMYTISSANSEMERIQQDMNNERIIFSKEKCDLDSLNKEFERRATTAEAALKRARMNYSIAVNQLQKDLELLSFQVQSMHETNENLIKQTFEDSLIPRFQECEETVQNRKSDSEDFPSAKYLQCQNKCYETKNQKLDGDAFSDDLRRSLLLQKGLYQKVEEELYEVHLVNVYLDVFSKTLQVTLVEASADFRLTKEKVHELSHQLELSTESNELLMLRLQTALDEIRCLNEYKETCNSIRNDLARKNQILEADLQNTTSGNGLLTQKIVEWKGMIKEYETYERKYNACATEKLQLENLLQKETLENGTLQNRLSSLQEELKSVRIDFYDLACTKEDLQNIVNFLQGKLWNLLASYDLKYKSLAPCGGSVCQDLESKDLTGVLLQIEELQNKVYETTVQMIEEKKGLVQERDIAQESLRAAESDNLMMKQKFEHDLRGTVDKLDVLGALVHKLQLRVEAIANRPEISSEAEDDYAQQHRELLSDLDNLEMELQQLTFKNEGLAEEFMALDKVTEELARCNLAIAALTEEKEALMVSLQDKTEESSRLALELNNLQGSLLSLHDEVHTKENIRDKLESKITDLTSQLNEKHCQLLGFDQQEAELVHLKQSVSDLELEKSRVSHLLLDSEECIKDLEAQLFEMHEFSIATDVGLFFTKAQYETRIEELGRCNLTIAVLSEEKELLMASLWDKTEESSKLSLELKSLQGSLVSLHDEVQMERNLRDKLESTITDLTSQLNEKHCHLLGFDQQKAELVHLKQLVSDLELEKSRVSRLLLDSEECLKDVREECSSISALEAQLSEMHEFSIAADVGLTFTKVQYETRIEELERYNLTVAELSEEKEALMESLQNKTEESFKLCLELNSMQGSMLSLQDELQTERNLRDKSESRITDLTSQLNEKNSQLLDFNQQMAELVHLKLLVSDLELEKSRVLCLLLDSEKCLKDARERCSSVSALEAQFSEMHEFSIAAEVGLTFTKTQYEAVIEELCQKLHFSDSQVSDIRNNFLSVDNMLNKCLASKRHYLEENTHLMTRLNSLKSELEASSAQNRILIDANSAMRTELEEYNKRADNTEDIVCIDKSQSALEVERLEHLLMTSEEEIDNLIFSKEELEVKALVLKAKLDEQSAQITMLEGYKDEMEMLHDRCRELTQKVAEQVLKTEEFKNLSIHFKDLKDKAYAEGLHAQDKKEPGGPPAAMPESLRIVFIKEQYETKLQELKQQLAISNKHSEEMLWKLQDAVNEVENKKKSEATNVKRNEELGMRILELESDLHSVLSEKREIMKAYDLMKSEKDCSLISLECCKEEKQELEASLQKCNGEKAKISLELTSAKELLESTSSSINYQRDADASGLHSSRIAEETLAKFSELDVANGEASQRKCMNSIDEPDQSNVFNNINSKQDDLVSRGVNGISSIVLSKQKDTLNSDMKHLVLANENFKAQSLKSSMENLDKELERMKHENLLLPIDDLQLDPNFPGLQREIMQLNKANEELGNIFPSFNEFSSSGNALERVLALEIELAEALRAKKKSIIQFQSSFAKQHSDEEAVFHSFRDINELIKDMLEIKGRYATVETELKDMHDRYSQLSLQFAEVEGERQKLMMTLKNVRASKKALNLNCSSTSPFLDPS
ncbi:early endosome antigen 1-like [Pyrus ussuriensis x Pyrus communis]|uniref:Early endosome antigen 1-like n=1 Tax=Pyrus ussuriensis x Pyrus communis TaxID=2448454 RepID=A0A5N5GNS1_9ROSA|nr:early endosome antigen 1-like [Pyrus ussuriensis x Pyrus communis]